MTFALRGVVIFSITGEDLGTPKVFALLGGSGEASLLVRSTTDDGLTIGAGGRGLIVCYFKGLLFEGLSPSFTFLFPLSFGVLLLAP